MEILNCNVISPGVAYGKILIVKDPESIQINYNDVGDEKEKLLEAIKKATINIDKQITVAKKRFDTRISEIFEAYKLIINDPLLIENTNNYINGNLKVLEAYKKAILEFIEKIRESKNEYMIGRIVDIVDATDYVALELGNTENKGIYTVTEPTIIITRELRASMVFSNIGNSVVGYISEKGFYHQHSGIIAREIKKPEVIVDNICSLLTGKEMVLIDSYESKIYIDPEESILSEKRRELYK